MWRIKRKKNILSNVKQLCKVKETRYYLCEFCNEIKQLKYLPKTFKLFVNAVNTMFQLNNNDTKELKWTYENFQLEKEINDDENCISFKDEGIELNEKNYHVLEKKNYVIIHLKIKEQLPKELNKDDITQQAKTRLIDKIKQNIKKQQDEIEQSAPLVNSIMISSINNNIKKKIDKMKVEIINEIHNYTQLQGNSINNKNTKNEMVIHNHTCSCCHINPIVGVMYKCISCKDYILCSNCEEKTWNIHRHPFYKLVHPIKENTNLNISNK